MRINTQKHFDTETARAIMERIVSPLVASLTIAVSNTTGTPLDELEVPVVWTPVINEDTNEISVIPSLIVASPDGEHILVQSTTTDPMNISDVQHIFTEKEEAEAFVEGYISSKQTITVEINCLVSKHPTSIEIISEL
jgi:hypothetical protein